MRFVVTIAELGVQVEIVATAISHGTPFVVPKYAPIRACKRYIAWSVRMNIKTGRGLDRLAS
jgi:hypothetical protein